MPLTDMKMTASEAKDAMSPSSATEAGPRYPWGLTINLDNESFDKLGEEMYAVGDELVLLAHVTVTSCSSSQSEGDRTPRRSCALQITKMCLEEPDDVKDYAGVLFGKPDADAK
jgi:hypothetical protein